MTSPARRTSRRSATEPRVIEQGHGQRATWWTYLADDDPVPELKWPQSIQVYDRMMTDSQVRSVLRAVTLPVRQARWRLSPGDARDEVVQAVATNFGLPIVGVTDAPPPVARQRERFDWNQHVAWALLSTAYGHMFFEQVYREDPATGLFFVRKLGPRWPQTIQEIKTAPDGGLESIVQRPVVRSGVPRVEPVEIPVRDLVAYVHEREGRWTGTSLLRPAYKHWLLKDEGLRTWAQTINRNGMGVPHYTASEDEDSLDAGTALAQSYRAGMAAGGAGPHGSQMQLLGVQGALPDIGEFVRYQDSMIATSVLAQFMNLGQAQGTGSYALGASFIDFFIMSLQSLAQFIADVTTQHVVEDFVDVNYGEDEPAPAVTFDPIGQNPSAVVAAVQALITAGAIFPDPALDAFVRQLVGLPPKAPLPNAQTPVGAAAPPPGTAGT